MSTIEEILLKLEKLNKLDSITDSIERFATICNDLQVKQNILELRVTTLTDENKRLKNQFEIVNSQLDRFKQHSLKTNLEIAGIPVTENENLVEISKAIFSHLGITEEKAVTYAYRKKSRRNKAEPPTIIVATDNKGLRDRVLKNKRKEQLDTTILINLQEEQNRNLNYTGNKSTHKRLIYINEHLTDFNKYILKRAKDLRRSGKIFGAWVRNGFVIIKKEADSIEQILTKISQIEELEEYGGNRFNTSVRADII